jgi:integrase
MLSIMLGCGLRRSQVAALTLGHIQQRDNRWCITDLVGKPGRVRTIPMPTWVKGAIDAWTSGAGLSEDRFCAGESRRSSSARWNERKCRLATPPVVRGCCRRSGHRSPRFEEELREVMLRGGRGTGANPIVVGSRFHSDDGAVLGHQARPRSRAERWDQTQDHGLGVTWRCG